MAGSGNKLGESIKSEYDSATEWLGIARLNESTDAGKVAIEKSLGHIASIMNQTGFTPDIKE